MKKPTLSDLVWPYCPAESILEHIEYFSIKEKIDFLKLRVAEREGNLNIAKTGRFKQKEEPDEDYLWGIEELETSIIILKAHLKAYEVAEEVYPTPIAPKPFLNREMGEQPDIEIFKTYFIADKDRWIDSLINDIKAHLKSGRGGYTIVAIAKVLFDSGKMHNSMKPKKFAPWLRAFCEIWNIDSIPTCKAGHAKVKDEIKRMYNVFYYLNDVIPK